MERFILHVDVNNAFPNGVTIPAFDETGLINNNAPMTITPANPRIINWKDVRCFFLLNFSGINNQNSLLFFMMHFIISNCLQR